MSDYGRLMDERDALLAETDRLRARIVELEAKGWIIHSDGAGGTVEVAIGPNVPCGCLAADVRPPDGKRACALDAGGELVNNAYCENRRTPVVAPPLEPAPGNNQIAVDLAPAEKPEPEPEGFVAMSETADQIAEEKTADPEQVDWDAAHQAETDKVIAEGNGTAEGKPNG